MPIQLVARANHATFTTTCTDGRTHRFRVSRAGELIDYPHDADADAVIAALGGEPHPCGQALAVLDAARTSLDAPTGTRDVAFTDAGRRGVRDTHICPTCPSRWNTAPRQLHYASPAHIAHRAGIDPALTARLVRWLGRDLAPGSFILPTANGRRGIELPAGVIAAMPAIQRPRITGYVTTSLAHALVTEPFIRAAAKVTAVTAEKVVDARNAGIKVEWLAEVTAGLSPATQARIKAADPDLLATLAKSRNVPAEAVSRYLKAGIYAHFRTYHRINADPATVLAVYRATNGTTSLAALLSRGHSLPSALAEVGVSA